MHALKAGMGEIVREVYESDNNWVGSGRDRVGEFCLPLFLKNVQIKHIVPTFKPKISSNIKFCPDFPQRFGIKYFKEN